MAQWFNRLSPPLLKLVLNWWAPFRCSGIRVKSISADYREIQVTLKQHWYNTNYVGTHFGGAMFSMTDPFYMLMLIKNLGGNYIVWDKAAHIEFIKPGRGLLTATFRFSDAEIHTVKEKTRDGQKYIFDKPIDIINTAGEVVATATRTLYVRQKLQP